jgi:hypothetical protein
MDRGPGVTIQSASEYSSPAVASTRDGYWPPDTEALLRRTVDNRQSLKIIGFDSWTGGAFNWERLLPALEERGMTFMVIHIGSWGVDPGRPGEERIGPLLMRDVTYYKGKSFEQVIDLEKPDAVLFLSTQTFAHRAFLRYCRQRKIPTFLIYHGIVNCQLLTDSAGSHRINLLNYSKYIVSSLGRLITRTFPVYIRALMKTNATFADWRWFILDVARLARGRAFVEASNDSATTKAAVYVAGDIEHATRTYRFAAEDVIVVGNPDLARFSFAPHLRGVSNRVGTSELATVMYLDTALAVVGLLFKDEQAFVEHLIDTSEVLASQGKKLVLKPHPAHDLSFLEARLAPAGIELIDNDRLVSTLQECCACITETTSVSLVPALLGMPLFYAAYGPLSSQRFGAILTSYPRGYVLKDVTQFSEILLKDEETFDSKAVQDWIERNSGPLPAEDMPRRVADAIVNLVNDFRSDGSPQNGCAGKIG